MDLFFVFSWLLERMTTRRDKAERNQLLHKTDADQSYGGSMSNTPSLGLYFRRPLNRTLNEENER